MAGYWDLRFVIKTKFSKRATFFSRKIFSSQVGGAVTKVYAVGKKESM
jgi:hypothetical protein